MPVLALEFTQILGEIDAVSEPTLEMRGENSDENVSTDSASSGDIDKSAIFDKSSARTDLDCKVGGGSYAERCITSRARERHTR